MKAVGLSLEMPTRWWIHRNNNGDYSAGDLTKNTCCNCVFHFSEALIEPLRSFGSSEYQQ